MKTTDFKDVTIRTPEARQVGDVISIGPSDTAKAGADSPDLGVQAIPDPFGNTSVEPEDDVAAANSNPSLSGLPVSTGSRSGEPDDLAQPKVEAPDEENSVNDGPYGARVSWPAGADGSSAGGVKTTDTLVQKTGTIVKFPATSDTSAPVKIVQQFE